MCKTDKNIDKADLINNILLQIEFFVDEDNDTEIFAVYNINNHVECRSLNDPRFKAYVREEYRAASNCDSCPDVKPYLLPIKDSVLLDGKRERIQNRIAGNHREVVYFLADPQWQSVIVNKNQWRIKQHPRYRFISRQNSKAQVRPKRGKALDQLLRGYINLDDDSYKLFKIHLIQCFLNSSSHFVSIISSEHGSGKSVLTKIIREIIDPAKAAQIFVPQNSDELKNHLANNFIVAFDNAQKLPDVVSDLLCVNSKTNIVYDI